MRQKGDSPLFFKVLVRYFANIFTLEEKIVLCPKCNFTTFEHAEVCKKCGYDLKAHKESKGIKTLKPAIKSPSPSPLPQGEDEVRGTGLEKSSRAEQEELTKSPKEAIISEVADEPQEQAEANNQPIPYNGSSKGVGSENPLERRKRNMQQAGTRTGSQEGSPVAGFFILIAAFFSMPIKTLKITIQELREVSNKGKLNILLNHFQLFSQTEIPS